MGAKPDVPRRWMWLWVGASLIVLVIVLAVVAQYFWAPRCRGKHIRIPKLKSVSCAKLHHSPHRRHRHSSSSSSCDPSGWRGWGGLQPLRLFSLPRRPSILPTVGARLVQLDSGGKEVKQTQNAVADWVRRRQRDRGDLSLHSVTVPSSGGPMHMSYLDRAPTVGTTDGREVVLLLHGFAADKDIWTLLAPHLPEHEYRLVAPDLPGFGDSGRRADFSYDVKAQTDRVLAFLDVLKIAKAVHVVGSSMGGNIAARLSIQHPERVRSLTLIGALGVLPPRPSVVQRALESGATNPLVARNADEFEQLLRLVFAEPPIPFQTAPVRKYFAERAINDSRFNLKIYDDLHKHPDWLERTDLANVQAPALVIWGDLDQVIDVSAAEKWQKGLRNCRTVILRGIGHVPPIEAPKHTAKELIAFLISIKNNPTPSPIPT